MMKTYHAKSELCINVRMDGGYRHVAFTPHTMGGSLLITDDLKLQQGIEQHRFFGTLISVTASTASQSPSSDSGDGKASYLSQPSALSVSDGSVECVPSGFSVSDGSAVANPQTLTFSSISEAKDYVADQWGISRSQLRRIEQIKRTALAHGVIIRFTQPHPE